ncbi:DUF4180 domain-containing protein [Streptomyces scabiei]|uniref:DUF4180 domain-containing protein n=1 Tax=Streptomyces scabiei TaxID=1930 RepID=UPI0036C4648B
MPTALETIHDVPVLGDAGYQGAGKFVQYGVRLAVIGDMSRHTEASSSLRDFVRECSRGRQTWFPTDLDEVRERLRA